MVAKVFGKSAAVLVLGVACLTGCGSESVDVGNSSASAIQEGAPTAAETANSELKTEMALLGDSLDEKPLTIRFRRSVHLYAKGREHGFSEYFGGSTESIAADCNLVTDDNSDRGFDIQTDDTFVLDGSTESFLYRGLTNTRAYVAFDLDQIEGAKGPSVYLMCEAAIYDSSCAAGDESCTKQRTKDSVRAAFERSLSIGPASIITTK